MTEYRCVVMDPPWQEHGAGKSKRGANRHYETMGVKDIWETVRKAQAWTPAADCHLWMWVTDNFLEDGLKLMKWLDFRYVRTMVWVKVKNVFSVQEPDLYDTVCELVGDHLQIGLGQYLRGSHELCLFGVRGQTMLPDTDKRPPSVIFATRTKHSRKPKEAFDVFEAVSPGPRLEMFARLWNRAEWDFWGREAPWEPR